MCANKVVVGVRCGTHLPNIRPQGTRQFASSQQINQFEGLPLRGYLDNTPPAPSGREPVLCLCETDRVRPSFVEAR
jgi:hypothetical protein